MTSATGRPRWIRVGETAVDLETGHTDVRGREGKLTAVCLATLVQLQRAKNGLSPLTLGREEGERLPDNEKVAARAHTRILRLRKALGPDGARLITEQDGRYFLHFTVDSGRSAEADAHDRLAEQVFGRLAAVGWHCEGNQAARGDRILDLAPLLRAAEWMRAAPALCFLPPLLGADEPTPLASVYVELRMAAPGEDHDPGRLGSTRSLADAIADRRRRRDNRARTVEDILAPQQASRLVILGDPGAGKSSLLRRIARDVVTGALPRWTLPILIDLPSWWLVRAHVGAACDLAAFGAACLLHRRIGPAAITPEEWTAVAAEARALAEALATIGGEDAVLFLCDGLDELAGAPEAFAAARAGLRDLLAAHATVVASRPAGFPPGGLEGTTRLVLCDLEPDGVQALVDAWFAHHPGGVGDAGRALAIQLRGNPRLMDMARNPFLLTLLCHLTNAEAEAGTAVLPTLRSSIYEAIFALAQVQAETRVPGCFDAPARDRLSALCLDLQLSASGPRHFFDEDDWRRLHPDAPALAVCVLPARMVSRWSVVGRFHMSHLTFHEFLVARRLVDDGRVDDLLDRLFQPGWSMILRFAAGLLASRGRLGDVARLVRGLLEPGDLLGRVTIDAAAMLVEAGVQDSTPILGYDLRERLWQVFVEGRPLLEEAAADALGVLDPEWACARAEEVLTGVRVVPRPDSSETTLAILRGRRGDTQRVLHLLGAIPRPRAEDLLARRVLDPGEDDVEGIVAATVLAAADRRHVRCRLASAVGLGRSRVPEQRFAAYASRAPHPDLVPACAVALGRSRDPGVWMQLLDALLSTATPEAWDVAFGWVSEDREGRAYDFAFPLASALRLVAGGPLHTRGRRWLIEAADDRALAEDLRAAVYVELVRVREAGPELAGRLARAADDSLLEAILEAGESAGVFGVEVEEQLARVPGNLARRTRHAVQVGRWLAGAPGFDRSILEEDLGAPSAEVRASALMGLGTVEAVDLLPRILDRPLRRRGVEATSLVGAVGLLAPTRLTRAQAVAPDVKARVVEYLERVLDTPGFASDIRQQAADGLAFWDFGRAGTRLADLDVRTALSRACAETGALAFEAGWRDHDGKLRRWG